ncbi:hypothetical protein D3C81_1447290 [compost metagenome]
MSGLLVQGHQVRARQRRGQTLLYKVQALHAEQELIVLLEGPLRIHIESIESHFRFGEIRRQGQLELVGCQHDAAALAVGVDAAGQILETGNGRDRRLCRRSRGSRAR